MLWISLSRLGLVLEGLGELTMIKFKDSECYPIKFDLFRLIAISDKLTFPMVWQGKYYLKKVLQIDKDSIFILGRSLTWEVEDD